MQAQLPWRPNLQHQGTEAGVGRQMHGWLVDVVNPWPLAARGAAAPNEEGCLAQARCRSCTTRTVERWQQLLQARWRRQRSQTRMENGVGPQTRGEPSNGQG